MPPTIDVFVTSILSNPAIRGRHERVRRALMSARVTYAEHDVAGDEAAKSLWKRKNGGKNELPFLLVDGEPVGSIEDLDEAVEFGELRQFLRLDAPASAPEASAPTSAPAAAPAPTADSASPPSSRPIPTLDDFADLDLTEQELAALAREIAAGDSFSSGLGSSSTHPGQAYDFSSTQRFDPVFAPTAPLRLEKVTFQRPLPDRPLASDVARDELDGIDQGELDEGALEALARELEAEEVERRRLRDAQGEGAGVEPPPVPEKKSDGEEPEVPPKDGLAEGEGGEASKAISVEGAGGAALSAPVEEVAALRLSPSAAADLASTPTSSRVDVAPPLPSSVPAHLASSTSSAPGPAPPALERQRTSPTQAAQLKAELLKAAEGAEDADPEKLRAVGGSTRVSELPDFAQRQEGKEPKKKEEKGREEPEREESTDGLADRVAEAIRGGDL
ncbi:hypothetical protein JCM10207_004267 [Rhodosporidiobolus poonsookiae]